MQEKFSSIIRPPVVIMPIAGGGTADVWGDDDDNDDDDNNIGEEEKANNKFNLLQQESETRRERFFNAGYRDGLDVGRTATVQKGFNEGYKKGFREGFEFGRVRGAVRSLKIFNNDETKEENDADSLITKHGIVAISSTEARRLRFEHRRKSEDVEEEKVEEHPLLTREALETLKKRLLEEENIKL